MGFVFIRSTKAFFLDTTNTMKISQWLLYSLSHSKFCFMQAILFASKNKNTFLCVSVLRIRWSMCLRPAMQHNNDYLLTVFWGLYGKLFPSGTALATKKLTFSFVSSFVHILHPQFILNQNSPTYRLCFTLISKISNLTSVVSNNIP